MKICIKNNEVYYNNYTYIFSIHQPTPCHSPINDKYRKQKERFGWFINPK